MNLSKVYDKRPRRDGPRPYWSPPVYVRSSIPVIRGAGYCNIGGTLRVAYRDGNGVHNHFQAVGIRLKY